MRTFFSIAAPGAIVLRWIHNSIPLPPLAYQGNTTGSAINEQCRAHLRKRHPLRRLRFLLSRTYANYVFRDDCSSLYAIAFVVRRPHDVVGAVVGAAGSKVCSRVAKLDVATRCCNGASINT